MNSNTNPRAHVTKWNGSSSLPAHILPWCLRALSSPVPPHVHTHIQGHYQSFCGLLAHGGIILSKPSRSHVKLVLTFLPIKLANIFHFTLSEISVLSKGVAISYLIYNYTHTHTHNSPCFSIQGNVAPTIVLLGLGFHFTLKLDANDSLIRLLGTFVKEFLWV